MAHGDICKDRMVEGIKMKSSSEWNKRAGLTNPTAEEPLALSGGWEGDSQCSSWTW